jgi:hypothetical protein
MAAENAVAVGREALQEEPWWPVGAVSGVRQGDDGPQGAGRPQKRRQAAKAWQAFLRELAKFGVALAGCMLWWMALGAFVQIFFGGFQG